MAKQSAARGSSSKSETVPKEQRDAGTLQSVKQLT